MASNSFAGSITDQQDFQSTVRGVSYGTQGQLIEVCSQNYQGSACKKIPTDNPNLWGFQGTKTEWKSLFNRCLNFEGINQLASVTQGVALIAVFWNIGALNAFAFGIGLDLSMQSPYPQMGKEEINSNFFDLVDYVLNGNDEEIFIPNEILRLLQNVVEVCAADFKDWQSQKKRSACLNSCHGTTKLN